MAQKKTTLTVIFSFLTDTKSKFWSWIKIGIFGGLALMYTFWVFDLMPELVAGPVGYVDDAIIWVLAAWAMRGAILTIMEKKATFLGPIGKN